MTHLSPLARLRAWVSAQQSKKAAADAVGCHPSYLHHLLAEGSERRPGLDVAFGIERATKGSEWAIKASEWVSEPELPLAETLEESGTGAATGEAA